MNRYIGAAAVGLGALTAAGLILRSRAQAHRERDAEAMGIGSADARIAPAGVAREHDPLGAAHVAPPEAAMHARAAERHVYGKNTSLEREGMFGDLRGVGVSGAMGGMQGREDQNPVGRHG